MKTVLLTCGTVGKTSDTAEVGDIVTAILHDENGMPVTETGEVAEVLD